MTARIASVVAIVIVGLVGVTASADAQSPGGPPSQAISPTPDSSQSPGSPQSPDVPQCQACPQCGGWSGGFVGSVCRDFQRRNCWPEPFVQPDRDAVRAPFGLMIANGWERQNLMIDQYFEDNGTRLTEAGRVRVRWIAFEAPAQHRVIYVHRSTEPEETAARVMAVQSYAAQVLHGQPLPPILESNASVEGWPAERVDVINKKFLQSIPAPLLPSLSQGGGTGGGGSTGGSTGGQ